MPGLVYSHTSHASSSQVSDSLKLYCLPALDADACTDAQRPAGNASFPYHNTSYTKLYIHALGYIYFAESAALALGTCTQHGHFFSADRVYAFCTGDAFVSSPNVRYLFAQHSWGFLLCRLSQRRLHHPAMTATQIASMQCMHSADVDCTADGMPACCMEC